MIMTFKFHLCSILLKFDSNRVHKKQYLSITITKVFFTVLQSAMIQRRNYPYMHIVPPPETNEEIKAAAKQMPEDFKYVSIPKIYYLLNDFLL